MLGATFKTNFCLEEVLAGAWDTEPITPSTGGIMGDLDATRSDDGRGELGNNLYKVVD